MTEFTPFSPTIGALGFWLMVAAVTVASIFLPILRQRESQKTLRSLIEKGQHLPPEVLADLINQAKASDFASTLARTPAQAMRALLFPGIILICMGPGVAMVGYFVGLSAGKPVYPIYGGACFLASIGVGMTIYALIMLRYIKAKGLTAE